jgi:choloylglycine hydrolase
MLKAADGSSINGRTVEFGKQIDLAAIVTPKNYAFSGTLPDGSKGMQYKAKYAVVGANAYGEDAVIDGLNEAGLSVGAFYFPGYADYADVTAENKSSAMSATEYANWLLTQFATVDEVKANYDKAVIVPTEPSGWGLAPPFHYVVYDKSGNSVVIEPLDKKLVIYDNPIGVITNSPDFTWHMTNLANYVNLSPMGATPKDVDGVKLQAFGMGSGLHGMPGDFTPPSRFVRAAIFSTTAVTPNDGREAVFQTFHILNQFDIPKGAVRAEIAKKVEVEWTLATTVKDPQAGQYYFRTYDNQAIQMVDLNAAGTTGKAIQTFEVDNMQAVSEIN